MGTGYQPDKKYGYRVPTKFQFMPTPGPYCNWLSKNRIQKNTKFCFKGDGKYKFHKMNFQIMIELKFLIASQDKFLRFKMFYQNVL